MPTDMSTDAHRLSNRWASVGFVVWCELGLRVLSLFQAKLRQTSIIKCPRYNLYITGASLLILQKKKGGGGGGNG